jgi:hypothetical protein
MDGHPLVQHVLRQELLDRGEEDAPLAGFGGHLLGASFRPGFAGCCGGQKKKLGVHKTITRSERKNEGLVEGEKNFDRKKISKLKKDFGKTMDRVVWSCE